MIQRVIVLFVGSATNTTYTTDPLAPWAACYRGGLAAPPPVQYLTATSDCAKAVYTADSGYILTHNPRCLPTYRTAAMGHILLDAANASFVPADPDDMLAVPLAPTAHISFPSVKAMHRYGTPILCQLQLDCRVHESCTNQRCTADPNRVKWQMLASFLTVTALMVAICVALASRTVSAPPYTTVDEYANNAVLTGPEQPFSVIRLDDETATPLIDPTEIEMDTV